MFNVLSTVSCCGTPVDACNKTGLDQCLGGGLTLPGLYDQYVNDSLFPVYDDVTLDVMCRWAERTSASCCYCAAASAIL